MQKIRAGLGRSENPQAVPLSWESGTVHLGEPGKGTPVITTASAAHPCLSEEPESPGTVRLLSHCDKPQRSKGLFWLKDHFSPRSLDSVVCGPELRQNVRAGAW